MPTDATHPPTPELESTANADGWTTENRTGGEGPTAGVILERGEEQLIANFIDDGTQTSGSIFLSTPE